MQPRAKSRVFTFVTICFRPLTAVFYLFLPQFCHNEMGQGLLEFNRRARTADTRKFTMRCGLGVRFERVVSRSRVCPHSTHLLISIYFERSRAGVAAC